MGEIKIGDQGQQYVPSDSSWIEPGAYEVMPGVYRIPLPLPSDALKAVNVYAIVDGDGLVMIDAGWAIDESLAQLTTSLESIEFGVGDIKNFLVTHIHRDHYSQALTIREKFGTHISLGEDERPSIELLLRAQRTGEFTGAVASSLLLRAGAAELHAALLAAREPGGPRPQTGEPDRWLAADELLPLASRELRVIATPGHTRGHVVYRDAGAGALFAGDHVLPHITPSIGLEPRNSHLPLGDYMESLALVRSMPDTSLLPAHGPVTDSVHARVDALLDHHEARLTASAAAVASGADSAFEVAKILRWTRRERHLDELDMFNTSLAVTETLAHLDVLVARGWLSAIDGEDGIRHFSR